jgi:hypothetical protein
MTRASKYHRQVGTAKQSPCDRSGGCRLGVDGYADRIDAMATDELCGGSGP